MHHTRASRSFVRLPHMLNGSPGTGKGRLFVWEFGVLARGLRLLASVFPRDMCMAACSLSWFPERRVSYYMFYLHIF